MSENMRESLSALQDDEASELELRRVLQAIGDDEELRATWSRYQMARASLEGHALTHPELDVSRRVSAAIASPAPARLRDRLMRPVISFAVAASVATVVVMGGQEALPVADVAPAAKTDTLAARPSPVGLLNGFGATTVRASYGTQPLPAVSPATRSSYEELARQRMGRYMQEHAEHAALNSPQGLIPFARVPQLRE